MASDDRGRRSSHLASRRLAATLSRAMEEKREGSGNPFWVLGGGLAGGLLQLDGSGGAGNV